jgi:hypothetical protein
MRLVWSATLSAAWGVAGVATALVVVQLLAPLGATALFLALSAAAAYAALTEIGARQGRDAALGSLAEAATAGLMQFLGVWALLKLGSGLTPRADAFLGATPFRSYAAVALAGAFAVALLPRMLARSHPELPRRLLVQGMSFWVSPFFGFFSPSVFAAMSLAGFGGAPRGWTGLGIAAGMVGASLVGRFLADWFTARSQPPGVGG